MKKLIITSHPSSSWFTHLIAHEYKKASEERNHEVEILDLYKTDLKQNFLFFESIENIPQDNAQKEIQKKISWADELIFIFPIWWWDCPAIMRNFFDQNFSAWFAFSYENWKAKWLLNWKKARIFASCDAPWFFYKFFPIRLKFLWWMLRLWFCWIDLDTVDVFDKMKSRNEEDRKVMLGKVRVRALI